MKHEGPKMRVRLTCLLAIAVFLSSFAAWSQTLPNLNRLRDPLLVRPVDKVPAQINSTQRIALPHSVHPWAIPANMVGEAAPSQPMRRMVLVLRPDLSQEQDLEELLRAQQDPSSPYFHQWLTPEAFGEHFGVSANDLAQVVSWLESQGMKIDEIPSSHRAIVFSGSVGQVEAALHTQMRQYSVRGKIHFANATNPEIPAELAGVIKAVFSLHDFRSTPTHTNVPALTLANGVNLLMPRDWATIYDVLPLYSQGLDGSGQSIAVIGRTDVDLTDVRTFRANAGLPAKDPQKIFPTGANPGMPDCEDESESALDVEWAGALAKNATIDFVTAPSGATDGVVLAAQYAVSNNVAPIVTMSYLHCENTLSDGGQSLWGSLWAQAASQGQSVFVASGDSGAAGCDSATAQTATLGKGVNAICSTPNSTCVGGTQFNEGSNPGAYWSGTNGAGYSSALSYIPEQSWNESSWAGAIFATGGGVSMTYPRPGWQSAPGVAAGNMLLVPDISASSAIHEAYVIQIQGKTFYVAGTSAAAPSLASVMALVLQNTGSRQGNANPALYTLASQRSMGGPAVFHDITGGNNSVPGVTGYNAGPGHDMTTGLGSVDAFLLVNSWNNSRASNFSLGSYSSSLTVSPGGTTNATLTMSAQGGFNSPATLSVFGAPSGVTVSFSSPPPNPSAPVTMTIAANASAVGGTFPIAVIGIGGGFSRTLEFIVNVSAASFTLLPSPLGASVNVGSSTSFTLTATSVNGFNSAVALSVAGLPAGVTGTFWPTSIVGGNGTSTLTISVSSSAMAGTSVLAVTGTGGNITQTQTITLAVANPNLTLSASATSASVAPGGSIPITLTTTAGTGFNSTVYLSVSGVPSGVTASFSSTSIPAPGSGSSTLTLTANSAVGAGFYTLTLGVVGGGTTKLQTFALTVLAPSFSLTPGASSLSVALGGSASVTFTTARLNGFSSAVVFSISALPTGVTASFTAASIASPGTGTSTLVLSAGSTVAAGTSSFVVTASGGGVTKTQTLNLTILAPSFTLMPSATSASVAPGGSIPITFTTARLNGFSSAVAMSVVGLPTGITASFAPSSIASPGAGTSMLTLLAGSTAAAKASTITVTASGGGYSKTQTLNLTVTGIYTFSLSASSGSLARGGSLPIIVTTAAGTGFNAPIVLSVSGVPSGVTATLSASSIGAPGSGSRTLTLAAGATATPGSFALTVTAVGGGIARSQTFGLSILTPAFSLSSNVTSASVARSGSTRIVLTTAVANGFNSAVALSVTGLPSGVTASFAPAGIAAPGNGSSSLTIAASSAAALGTPSVTVTALGGGITRTQVVKLNITTVLTAVH